MNGACSSSSALVTYTQPSAQHALCEWRVLERNSGNLSTQFFKHVLQWRHRTEHKSVPPCWRYTTEWVLKCDGTKILISTFSTHIRTHKIVCLQHGGAKYCRQKWRNRHPMYSSLSDLNYQEVHFGANDRTNRDRNFWYGAKMSQKMAPRLFCKAMSSKATEETTGKAVICAKITTTSTVYYCNTENILT